MEETVHASIRQESIEHALQNIHVEDGTNTLLITDGGPENKFGRMNSIIHKKALIDVCYSNSLIEAHNKLLKYNYLYKLEITDIEQLRRTMDVIISDFNNRPHVSLDGLTPNEAYENKHLDREKIRSFMKASAVEWYNYNKSHRCEGCND